MKTRHVTTLALTAIAVANWLVPKKPVAEDAVGADARSPSEIPPRGWWLVAKRAAAGFNEDRVMTEAAGVTFYVLLALFPALASFISIYGLFADPSKLTDQLQNLGDIVPGGGLDLIRAQVMSLTSSSNQALGFGALVGLATSLWSANAGMKSLFGALNVVYHEKEKRSYLKFTLEAFAFTLGAIAFIILALFAVVAIPVMLNFVGLSSIADTLLRVARWPVMLIVVSMVFSLIYRFGPSRNRAKWQWVSWGGAFAAVFWVIASLAFSFYVANFGNYNKTYGTLGAAIGFMTWIWISTMVVLMGAELNAELERQTGRDSTVGAEKPPGIRGAYMADVKS
jgi:membrane protein